MSLEDLISQYGYAAIGIGTFFEGETILVLGGFAAHRGYLELPWVLVCAFLGTLCGDQLYFYLGRSKGMAFLEKRPRWKTRSDRFMTRLGARPLFLVISFRFFYGLRTIIPFLLGASAFSPWRFFLLNALGAAIWAVVIGTAGFLFGHVLELLLGRIEHYEREVFLLVAAVGAGVGLLQRMKGMKRKKDSSARPGNRSEKG